ncbi:META domain-containing protein [uncultured Methanoregula sp.]|uniref:META domain-containing protein n=1 Tax=uncultured Methanoregula sp. TaxID=1005933 RepID=UPI002AABFB16|nr:META domain-containing protein [uncultured Methanoregula sp.]
MTGEYDPDIPDDADDEYTNNPCRESQKPGLYLYIGIALLGCLVFLVVIVNIPGIEASAGMTMTRTSWQLQTYADASGGMDPVISPNITARFGKDGRLIGFAGCNDYIATYSTTNYAIQISPPATSLRQCPEPGVTALETLYLKDLGAATEFRVTDEALKLYNKTGQPLLVFVPA